MKRALFRPLLRWAVVLIGIVTACIGLVLLLDLGNAYGRPPQPLPLGTIIWDYEHGFSVLDVRRTKVLIVGARRLHARGTFYVVDAKVYCPFGERYAWDDANVYVETMSPLRGGLQFATDPRAQRLLDEQDRRPGPRHVVLGASQSERLVFDLPDDVVQPALLFRDTLGLGPMADAFFSLTLYEPHRFNLRYD